MNSNFARLFRLKSVGMRFNKLVITGISERTGFVKCRCDCGIECEKFLSNIKRNTCKSCGCLNGEIHDVNKDKSWKPTYASWSHMKGRCLNSKEMHFKNYGGRGIQVCERWKNSFEAFLCDMGKRPDGRTLDRIDVNGMYCPENCRWATKLEQDNNRRGTIMVSVNGASMSFMNASRLLGFHHWVGYVCVRKKKKTAQQFIDDFIKSKQLVA